MSVDTWGPFVFVNPDPDAEPLAAALGDLPEIVAANGLDIDALEYRDRQSYELRANWKVAIENYLECYHCAITHPGFVDAVDDRALRLETGRRGSASSPRCTPARSSAASPTTSAASSTRASSTSCCRR